MCLVVVALDVREDLALVLAGNRDEFHARPTAPLAWRDLNGTQMLAGQDLQAGGTWLGIGPSGRFAAVTNFRQAGPVPAGGPSRGELVTAWLGTALSADEFAAQLQQKADDYAPFNLLFGNAATGQLHYLSNRAAVPAAQPLEPGIHTLSNHLLNTPWPKTRRTRQRLADLMDAPDAPADEALFDLLADRAGAPDSELPNTGIGMERERVLAPPFIVTDHYGTRCSSVVAVTRRGVCRFVERSFDAGGKVSGQRHEQFHIEMP